MGGAQGSMMHPYDNMDLKICDFISIARKFTKRNTWNEKFDGINITWSYINGEFYIARNKEQLKDPVSFKDYREKLDGHPAKEQFLKGLAMIEAIGDQATYFTRIYKLFDYKYLDQTVWINTELIDQNSPQLFRYDEDCLIIHNLQCLYDNEFKIMPAENLPTSKLVSISESCGTKIYGKLEISLPPVDFPSFIEFESSLYKILAECDLTPQAKIKDIVHFRVYEKLSRFLDLDYAWMIADNVSGQGKHDIRIIKQKSGQKRIVDEFGLSKNKLKVQNQVLRDLKDAWLKFGAKVLNEVQSNLIMDPQKADQRLQKSLQFNSEFLATLDRTDNNYLVWCEMYQKFADYRVHMQLIEGVVFKIGEDLYKLTGAFQLQNRLCGLARYEYGQKMEERV